MLRLDVLETFDGDRALAAPGLALVDVAKGSLEFAKGVVVPQYKRDRFFSRVGVSNCSDRDIGRFFDRISLRTSRPAASPIDDDSVAAIASNPEESSVFPQPRA